MVVFDSEVVMRLTFEDQIVSDFVLGQQGIGGNILSLNIDGIKQGDSGFDFVGALDLLVGYRQVTYFFWV